MWDVTIKTISRACSNIVARYCPLWANHSLTILFLGTHEQWVTHPGSALVSFSLNFGVPTEPEASELEASMICSFWAYHSLTVLFFGNSQATSWWITYPVSALASFSLNFGVLMEPVASELPKGLVLGRDRNIHLRITPLGDVGCYN
ncbi:hypothetical protein DVH24_036009 [Malus domestica]|uniref:Uncharacterized protein n=1 Tax=Malus domestica TaxID=3750 RepID=A0A498JVV5_MALDO|nr:hypothetical protein DVH24_036009 [Malus domestica]